ncbi:MAG: MAPEG family protein [Pseudohongiellaceae bacterium]|nr:MAPEG family protein [Pseudohongiellaceae bacterium]
MNQSLLVYPMFVMVLLTASIVIRTLRARIKSVKKGEIEAKYYRLYQGAVEPEETAKLTRHFSNLFEAPVLFYAVCVAAMSLNITGLAFLLLSWAYVVTRIVHTIVHTGRNRLRNRMIWYFASWTVLLAMWGVLVVQASISRL